MNRILRRQEGKQRNRCWKLRVFLGMCRQHFTQPVHGSFVALISQLVDGPLRESFLTRSFPERDQPGTKQLTDRLIEARALFDIDDLILTALLDESLHPIRVHRCLMEEGEYG